MSPTTAVCWKLRCPPEPSAIDRPACVSRVRCPGSINASSMGARRLLLSSRPGSQIPQIPLISSRLLGAKHLIPLAKHQRRPEKCRTVVVALLVLVPDLFQETPVENPVIRFHNHLVGHFFQLALEPNIMRDCKS